MTQYNLHQIKPHIIRRNRLDGSDVPVHGFKASLARFDGKWIANPDLYGPGHVIEDHLVGELAEMPDL